MVHLPLSAPKRPLTLSLLVLVTLFTLSLSGLAPAQAIPTILNASPTAHKGDVIFLQGAGFGSNPLVQFSWNSTAWTFIPTISHANNLVTFRMQSNYSDLLTVRVSGDGGSTWTPTYFINQAHAMSFDTPEVAAVSPGSPGSPFRIFGRNLYFGGTPTVRLVDTGNGASFPATVNVANSNAYVLSVTAPSGLAAGDTYNVLVDNGLHGQGTYTNPKTGTYGTLADETLKAVNYGVGASDVWNLGVPWGANFSATSTNVYNVQNDPRLTLHAVGDGVNNDQPAIQAALTAARYSSQGGGVVYLPAGTYKLVFDPTRTAGLTVWSNVVLAGAGMNQTTVRYGFPGPNGGQNYGVSLGNGWDTLPDMGIADMTLQNVDTTGQWNENLFLASNPFWHSGQTSSELFMQRVKFIASSGTAMSMQGITKLAVENCDFEMLGGNTAIWVGAGAHSEFYNNTLHWSGGQAVWAGGTPDVVIENNAFIRDCNYALYPREINTRSIDTSYNKNMTILNNTFNVINGTPAVDNCGETICSEGSGGTPVDADYGTATGATATTLTDTTKNWTVPNDGRGLTTCFSSSAVVAIVGGTGAGQWQPIQPNTSPNTLTLTAPGGVQNTWKVIPDKTSKYTIMDWSCENWLVAGNQLNNNQRGIYVYSCSAHDYAIVGNTLTNNGGILLRSYQQVSAGSSSSNCFYPIWDTQVVGNTVSENLSPPIQTVGDGAEEAYIGTFVDQVYTPVTLGTSILGVEFRGNAVTGTGATFDQEAISDPNHPPITEGYYDLLISEGSSLTNNLPALLGTIFQGNTATNCNTTNAGDGAIRLNSGAFQTVIADTVLNRENRLIEDEDEAGLITGSVGTYGSLNILGGNNWMDADIGGPAQAGSASLSNGVFTVSGSGGGIQTGAVADQINFCYQTVTGNVNATITARVTGEVNTSQYAAAGVMFRHSVTDPISAYFVTDLYPNWPSPSVASVLSGCRYTDDGIGGNTTILGAVPYWVKAVRSGNTFTGYAAPDWGGAPGTWTAFTTQTIPGSSSWNMDMGLLSQGGNNSALNAATFDNVSVTTP